jgi:hypothetical protein
MGVACGRAVAMAMRLKREKMVNFMMNDCEW